MKQFGIVSCILKNLILKCGGEYMEEKVVFYKAQKLYWVLMTAVNLAIYKRNSLGRGTTYCNVMAYEVLDSRCKVVWRNDVQVGASLKENFAMGGEIDAYDYDITPIMRDNNIDNLLSSPIPLAYDQGIKAAEKGIIEDLTPEQAQMEANAGIPILIFSKALNHAAIVAPNFHYENSKWILYPYEEEKGCFTGNAGQHNDMMYMKDRRGFGYYDWESKEIKYWKFKECK